MAFCLQRRRLLGLGVGLPWVLGLLACGRPPVAPLRIAAHIWPGYELMYLAQREGWLAGAAVALSETQTSTESIKQLAAGQVEGAALTLDEVLRVRADGTPLAIVLVFDESAGADALMARPELDSLSALAGKRIGAETTALGAFILRKVLTAANLSLADVTLVDLPADGHRAAWEQGDLDALLTYEPTVSQLEASGARRLFDSRQLPGTILDVLAVRTDVASRHADALIALMAAHFHALKYIQTNPQDAAYRMAGHLDLPAGEVMATFRGLHLPSLEANRRLLAPAGTVLATAAELSGLMVREGLLPHEDSLTELVSGRYLPRDPVS